MIGQNKSVYHSTLVKFGPAYITLKSDVMKSKKGDGHYLVIEHEGDDQFLNVENDACAQVLRHRKGESLTIKATGSRDDAEIQIMKSDGSPEAPAQRTATPPARPEAKAESGQPNHENAKHVAWQAGTAINMALDQASAVKFGYDAEHSSNPMTPEQFQAITSSIFIHLDKRGVIHDL